MEHVSVWVSCNEVLSNGIPTGVEKRNTSSWSQFLQKFIKPESLIICIGGPPIGISEELFEKIGNGNIYENRLPKEGMTSQRLHLI